MAIFDIVTYGNPVLRKEAAEVTDIDDEIRRIINDVEETLSQQNGIGLAATQIGISKKILSIDLTKSKGDKKISLINPVIITRSKDEVEYEEGCLSVPEVWGNVSRPRTIKIKGTLKSGKTLIIEAEDLFARVLQHEIDHLEGKLFIDYLSQTEKEKYKEKINSIIEKNKVILGKVCL